MQGRRHADAHSHAPHQLCKGRSIKLEPQPAIITYPTADIISRAKCVFHDQLDGKIDCFQDGLCCRCRC